MFELGQTPGGSLVESNHRDRDRIAESKYDVLRCRVRLSAAEKLGILGRGMIKAIFHTL